MKKILLLEDDPVLGRGLQLLFELEGFFVIWHKNIADAKHNVQTESFDLAVLDVGLPDGSGVEFCEWLRKFTYNFPLIMLTAQTDEDSVVKALTSGANDYIRKPFSNKELIARIMLHLKSSDQFKLIQLGELSLNIDLRKVEYHNIEIKLNRKEFDILTLFALKKDAIVTREMIIERALDNIDVSDRTVDSHISHIRSKLAKSNVDKISIISEYGIGYRLRIL